MDKFLIKDKTLDFFKNNQWGLLLLSVTLGVVATLLANFYIKSRVITMTGGSFVPVVGALEDIDAGAVITQDMVMVKKVPSTLVHSKAVPEQYKDFLIGQRTADKVAKGQMVLWNDISLEEPSSLSVKLNVNERAISINVDAASCINGLLQPGDRVDILASFDIPGDVFADTQSVTKVLLQNITVLAVGQQMDVYDYAARLQEGGARSPVPETEKVPSTITLKVPVADVGILAFAERKGNILLILRNREDVFVEPRADIKFNDIVKFQSVAEAPRMKKKEGYPLIYEDGQRIGDGYQPGSAFGSSTNPIIPQIKDQINQLMKEGNLEQFVQIYQDQIDKAKEGAD